MNFDTLVRRVQMFDRQRESMINYKINWIFDPYSKAKWSLIRQNADVIREAAEAEFGPLPPGDRNEPDTCPIARATGRYVEGNFEEDGPVAAMFVLAFDDGQYPDLDAHLLED